MICSAVAGSGTCISGCCSDGLRGELSSASECASGVSFAACLRVRSLLRLSCTAGALSCPSRKCRLHTLTLLQLLLGMAGSALGLENSLRSSVEEDSICSGVSSLLASVMARSWQGSRAGGGVGDEEVSTPKVEDAKLWNEECPLVHES